MTETVVRYAKTSAKFLVAAVLVWAIFYFKIISVSDIVGLSRYPYHLIFFCLCMGILYSLSSVRWHILMSCQGIAPPFSQTFRMTYIASFWASSLLGGVGSDFSRGYMLFKHVPDGKRKGVISIVVDKIASLAALLLLACLCVAVKFEAMADSPLFTVVSMVLIMGGVFFVGFVAILFVNKRRLGFSKWIETRFSDNPIARHLLLVMEAFYIYRSSPMVLISVLAISLVNQSLMVLVLYQLGILLGGTMALLDIGISGPTTILLNMLPISPGGLGVGEVAFAQINSMLNPSSVMTVSGTVFLTFRIITIVTSIPAVLFLFRKDTKA